MKGKGSLISKNANLLMQDKYSTWVILAKAFFFEEIWAWNPFYPDLRIYSFYSVLWLSLYLCSHLTHQYLLNSHRSQTLYCLLENLMKRFEWSSVLLLLGRSMYCFGVWVLQGWAVERTRPGSGADTCSVTSKEPAVHSCASSDCGISPEGRPPCSLCRAHSAQSPWSCCKL